MSLKERCYSILILSSNDSFSSAFTALLSHSRYGPVQTVSSVSKARGILTEHTFDFIIVNSPLTDEDGMRFSIDSASSRQTVVLLLVKNEIHEEIHDRTAEYGVFTLPKPLSKVTLLQALGWMESARERLRLIEKKSLSIEEKMAEIRMVNRAKWLLIRELGMSEPDAHRYIEKQAMDRCVSKQAIAQDIIKMYS